MHNITATIEHYRVLPWLQGGLWPGTDMQWSIYYQARQPSSIWCQLNNTILTLLSFSVYHIFQVYCDMDIDNGGWVVFQKRMDGTENFYRGWADYVKGFGDLSGEFWLGLNKIHRLTQAANATMRVDLTDFEGGQRYAKYTTFWVLDSSRKYQLNIEDYSGDAGDSLAIHNGMNFSTKDQDNDDHSGSCAVAYKGAWWYESCHYSNLNGKYLSGHHTSYADGVQWYHWKGYNYSLKITGMKLR